MGPCPRLGRLLNGRCLQSRVTEGPGQARERGFTEDVLPVQSQHGPAVSLIPALIYRAWTRTTCHVSGHDPQALKSTACSEPSSFLTLPMSLRDRNDDKNRQKTQLPLGIKCILLYSLEESPFPERHLVSGF